MRSPETRHFHLRGLRLHARVWPGRGPAWLAVHATGLCAEVWGPVVAAARRRLGDRMPPVVALDQRGHGRSDAPADAAAYAWHEVAEDVAAVARVLSAEGGSLLLVGHSSGATAALCAAALASDCARGVAAVEPVLFDPPLRPEDDSFAGSGALAARARKRRAGFESRAAAREGLASRFPYRGFDGDVLEAFLAGGLDERGDGSVCLRCRPEHEAFAYAGAAALDAWPLVSRLPIPVLLVAAEHSAIPAPMRQRLAESVPALAACEIAGATHFAALERPREVGEALARFWRDVER
jgi:pimeloyl-ACP methyl ester carboxylesterase